MKQNLLDNNAMQRIEKDKKIISELGEIVLLISLEARRTAEKLLKQGVEVDILILSDRIFRLLILSCESGKLEEVKSEQLS